MRGYMRSHSGTNRKQRNNDRYIIVELTRVGDMWGLGMGGGIHLVGREEDASGNWMEIWMRIIMGNILLYVYLRVQWGGRF